MGFPSLFCTIHSAHASRDIAIAQPALTRSLDPHLPPFIYFPSLFCTIHSAHASGDIAISQPPLTRSLNPHLPPFIYFLSPGTEALSRTGILPAALTAHTVILRIAIRNSPSITVTKQLAQYVVRYNCSISN